MRAHTLGLSAWEGGDVWVFDDFELVLLVGVEEAVEGACGEVEGFGQEGDEGLCEGRHGADVGFVDGSEGGEVGGVRPLVWPEEVIVERVRFLAGRVRSGYIDLLSPVSL